MLNVLYRFKIKTRLLFLIGFFILVFVSFSAFYLVTFNTVKVNGPYYNRIVQGKDLVADILPPPDYIIESYLVVLEMVDETDKVKLNELVAKCTLLKDEYLTRHSYWEKNLPEGQMKDIMISDTYKPVVDFYDIRDKDFIPAVLNGDKGKAKIALDSLKAKYEEHRSSILKVVDMAIKENSDAEKSAADIIQSRIIIFVVLGLIMLPLLVVLGVMLSNTINKPIKKLIDIVNKLANGDLNVDSSYTSKDEIGVMMKSFDVMIDNMRNLSSEMNILTKAAIEGNLDKRGDSARFKGAFNEIITGVNNTLTIVVEPLKEATTVLEEISKGNFNISVKGDYKGDHALIKNSLNKTIDSISEVLTQINVSSEQVSQGASQVANSSGALSQASTEQASSIQEITSSMTEVAEQTKQNALNANQASELANTAKDNAATGNDRMKEMLKAMQEINDSSTNISKIIKVIDEIAFQTNILALNAAVEAARAGQHGKGFAVVAEEVRNLAARSANAAKETTAMIEGSIKKVEIGTKMAGETAQALNKIVDGVANAATIVGRIASASNEQATAISQINVAIDQVAQVVQTNSATAEESAAASEEMSGLAQTLRDIVGRFTLKKMNIFSTGENESLSPEMLKAIEKVMNSKPSKSSNKNKALPNGIDFGKY